MELYKHSFHFKTKYLINYFIPIQVNICFCVFLFVLFSVFIFLLDPY